jgi:hypothetical protein
LTKLVGVIRARVEQARKAAISRAFNGRSIARNSKYWYSLIRTKAAAIRLKCKPLFGSTIAV